MNVNSIMIPSSLHWTNFLQHHDEINLEHLLQGPLLNPVNDFFSHPGKNIRSQLIRIGFQLSYPEETSVDETSEKRIQLACSIIEAIHGGALIVDDIQDGSIVRRNEPTLHLKYGLPKALNAGNWMYFWALEQIKHLDLDPIKKDLLMDQALRLLSMAHLGQALDVGTRIDEIPQSKVYETSLASIELKTGTLMSLALITGGMLGKAENIQKLDEIGARLGIALQMFDDLGNFFNTKSSAYKRLEDLKLRRPTWIWAMASRQDEQSYSQFLAAVRNLPDEKMLDQWIHDNDFKAKSIGITLNSLRKIKQEYENPYSKTHPQTWKSFLEMIEVLEKSYV